MTQAADSLIDRAEIRRIFRLGRTAAYELTHRPEFSDPVLLSPRCYRWWASEVAAFALSLQWTPAPCGHDMVRSALPARSGSAAADHRHGECRARQEGVVMTGAAESGRPVIELEHGIAVYPPMEEGGRWRAVWYEDGQQKQCESVAYERLGARLEKVKTEPVIGEVTCEDITTVHTQKIVNAAPTAGEGDRVHRMVSAMVNAGVDAGYLANPRLGKVHWQAGERPVPEPTGTVAGESALWVDPAEIPSACDVGELGRALAAGPLGQRDELMAQTAAYSGLRWGELAALGVGQVDPGGPGDLGEPEGRGGRRAPGTSPLNGIDNP